MDTEMIEGADTTVKAECDAKLNILLPSELYDRVKSSAAFSYMSISAFVRQALARHVEFVDEGGM